MSEQTPQNQEPSSLQKAVRDIVAPFKSLAHSPRSLWGLYASYLLEGLVYFGIVTILGKYLSENVGLADLHAGWVYSGFTGGITLAMLFLGGVADRIGVRRALLLSMGMMVLGRTMIATSGVFFEQGLGAGSPMFLAVVLGLFIVVLGYGTYQPAAYAAVKRFTTEKTASMGYAMIYGLMNLGAFFSGLLSPPIRRALGIESVFWVFAGICLLAFLVVFFVMTRRVVERDTITRAETPKTKEPAAPLAPLWTPAFIVLVLASLASITFLARSVVTTPPGPGQQATIEARRILREGGNLVGGTKTSEERKEALDQTLARLAEESLRIELPTDLPQSWTTDESLFDLVRGHLLDGIGLLGGLEAGSLEATVPAGAGSPAMVVRDQIRTLGLFNMAAAYAMVSPMDEVILGGLRRRMKTPQESIIPLDQDAQTKILEAVALEPVPMLEALRDETRATQEAAMEASAELGALIGALLEVEIRFLDRVLAGRAELEPKVRALTKERLLKNAPMMLMATRGGFQSLPEILEAGTQATQDEARLVDPSTILANWLGDEALFAETLRSTLGAGVIKPQSRRILGWILDYGVWLLALLAFVGMAFWSFLAKRPQHPFRDLRFVFFIFILIPVQTLFAHSWLTLPYYTNRAFGGSWIGDNFETIANLNPILIFFLAPIVTALTTKAKVYRMMILGTFVMASPAFLLTLPPAPVFLLGYILIKSIGEAMWMPRFLQWVAEIAPEGQVGTYMGIGQFPWFLTKVFTGLYSGAFLDAYCPMVGPQNTQFMWLIYAMIAITSPIALLMARSWMLKGQKKVN